jgi:hypothetical protein
VIVPFSYDVHAAFIEGWLKKRDLPMVTRDMLPNIGFIDPEVAVVFGYRADGALGLMDRLVINPDALPVRREFVVTRLFGRVFEALVKSGAKQVYSLSDRPTTARRICAAGVPPYRPFTLHVWLGGK